MVETEIVETKQGAGLGIKIDLHGVPALVIKAEKGFLCCGIFDKKALEKFDCCAVVVTGVKSFREMLKKKVAYVTKKAKKIGIRDSMTGEQALNRML